VKIVLLFAVFISVFLSSPTVQASPWAQNTGYFGKAGGKFLYGLKNVVFGWMMMFGESQKPEYSKEWEGFCVGISKSIVYTANGLVQLATFPVPVDFPDVGRGVYIPKRELPSSKKEKFAGIPAGKKVVPDLAAEKPQDKTEKPLPEKKIEAAAAPSSPAPKTEPLKTAPAKKDLAPAPETPPALKVPAPSKLAVTAKTEAISKTARTEAAAAPSSPAPKTEPLKTAPAKKDLAPAPETPPALKVPAPSKPADASPNQAGPEKAAVTVKPALAEPVKPAATPKPALAEPVKIMKEKTPTILISPPPPYVPHSINAPLPAYEPAKVAGIAPTVKRQPSIPAKKENPESETEIRDVSSLPSNEPLREPFFGGVKSVAPSVAEKFKAEETKPPATPAEKKPESLPETAAGESEEQTEPPAKTGASKEGPEKEDAMDEEILKILKEAEKYKQPK
jgi:hypothetical protein